MIRKNHSADERGIAHLGLIVLLLVVVAVGYFAYNRVSSANDDSATQTSAATSDDSEDQVDDAEQQTVTADQQAVSADQQANSAEVENVTQ